MTTSKKVREIKTQAFVDAYFDNGMNATRAYKQLNPNCKNGSAWTLSSRLLGRVEVQAAIQKRFTENAMGADEVLSRLADMGRASIQPFVRISEDGAIFFNFSDQEAQKYLFLIKKVKAKRTRRVTGHGDDAEEWEDEWVEVELHDAQTALEKIGKVHKLFVERYEMDNKLSVIGLDELLDKVYGSPGKRRNSS